MGHISFGTSGWRGIFCEDFTFENVRVVTQAIADHLRASGDAERGVVVGYDTRFMGGKFARETVRVLAGAGIRSWLCDRDTPTPVVAWEIIRRRAGGGINFTASHNPSDYNGLKFSPASGGPALPEETKDIEQRANAMLGEICFREMDLAQAERTGLMEVIDPREAYFKQVRKLVDFDRIGRAGLHVGVNTLYGTGRGYLDALLREAGAQVTTWNDRPDPYFGGHPPEPAPEHMEDFIAGVRGNEDITLGLATDGDADRYGVVDADGTFIEPNYILALVADFLVRRKGKTGAVARSVATSHLIDAVAAHHGLELLETPVGFKFIGDFIAKNRILIGGEESAGLSVRGHVPDKDGILACLLVAEMVAAEKKGPMELLRDLYRRVGEFHTRRVNLRLSDELEEFFPGKMAALPSEFAGKKVAKIVTIDGVKLVLEGGSWVLFRKSGTEPVVRVYAEAGNEKELELLITAASRFVTS